MLLILFLLGAAQAVDRAQQHGGANDFSKVIPAQDEQRPVSDGLSMVARIAVLFGMFALVAIIARLGGAIRGDSWNKRSSPKDRFFGGVGGYSGGYSGGGGFGGGGAGGFGGGCSGGGGSSGGW